MISNISGDTPIAALTVAQFANVLVQIKSLEPCAPPAPVDYTHGVVHGLRGIRQLFGVSHATAQRYKDTFLKPAVRQNGRKIVVDVALALGLFNQQNK